MTDARRPAAGVERRWGLSQPRC